MKIQPFERHTQKYENWFKMNKFAYRSEVKAIQRIFPKSCTKAVEIGVGSGRFASPLDIRIGLDPSEKMLTLARKRGIRIIIGIGEEIPFIDDCFDCVLMITTICFLDNIEAAFKEIHRILKPNGYFINGFVDKNSKLGEIYQTHKHENVFYKFATFYSVGKIIEILHKSNFHDFEFAQTIFHDLPKITTTEKVERGYGKGSFVVIKAKK
ncbi:MAG: methyltransferase domain-containing protein [Candidatus Lokiarchaeota archaeon]|nr:methyltransferase domain-containing protein [Candidatus Lokiarchaeota archaeon]